MNSKLLKRLFADKDSSIKETAAVIDRNGLGIAFIVDKKKKLLSVVTDGDIRRAVLDGLNPGKKIGEISNKNPIVFQPKRGLSEKEIRAFRNSSKIRNAVPTGGSLKVPVLDSEGRIRDLLFVGAGEKKISLFSDGKIKLSRRGVKKVLITGGAGYLGSILSRKLLDKGYKVRVFDNLTYGDEGIRGLYKNKNFQFIKGDARDISQIIEALKGVDAVIHLAAIVGDPACQLDPKETIETNYLSTKAVAEACKFNQINKFLFASTCSVYGASKGAKERLKENSFLNPVSLYAETKLKSEEGVFSLADENFSPTVFRFATLYGASPRMRFDLVVNIMTANAVSGGNISITGGEQWRPNLDVSDAAEACLRWLESPIEDSGGEIFNVGVNNQNYRIIEIGRKVVRLVPGTRMEISKEKGDLRDYNVSFDKIARVLKFKPKKTMENGILEMKKLLQNKKIKDFKDYKYNNYRFLSNGKKTSFK